jgi:endonuclease/exonuclease/phosphatase family metal-dependent hydrolase
MKKLFRIIIILVLLPLLYVGIVILYGTAVDWEPQQVIPVKSTKGTAVLQDSVLEFISWNIGFGGLGEETSFFYDGGETVIQEENLVQKNLEGVHSFLHEYAQVDFVLLQEVDSASKRSHYINQLDYLCDSLPWPNSAFTMNFNVDFVPLPFFEPMGQVRSGLATLSAYETHDDERLAFDTQFEWPRRVFFLDRCFLKQHVTLESGNELIIINTHCSAYDTSGELVEAEIQMIMDYALSEYELGNYVVIGGDWNQCPPSYEPIEPGSDYNERILSEDQIPDNWKWVYDIQTPTNRKLDKAYNPETSYTSCIDHFVVSPNIQVEEIRTVDLDFRYSDHQPIYLRVSLN